ncbi:hypothetical protein BC477_12135 [Clavibacter michiganensis subsp. michiganensis]|uniref:Uncharacterized protein n=1 Tax=Clavibacter michiganensis subsp. michiganensis TaxID=33013 RepID=A0A251XHI3_CLAMM|nr:hypothetical protein BC477_12135 [Clavibacter michiganensis subsp. michiganensis]OUE02545.1 hypothetical protein CMMCAS07_11045 [Clavibacter michiganensis subsp. michiganensis]
MRSVIASAAIAGPTRFTSVRRTTRIRSAPATRTRTSSPGRTDCDAFARSSATFTCPARQAAVACDRVL